MAAATTTTTSAAAAATEQSRVAVVTGGAQGIGRAISNLLLTRGYRVVVADIDAEAGAEYVKVHAPAAARDATPPRVAFVQCDVSSELAVAALMAAAVDRFGGIDVVVNNAALAMPMYALQAPTPTATAAAATAATASSDAKAAAADATKQPPHPLETLSLDVWNKFLAVNVTSVMLTAKHALPHLRAAAKRAGGGGAAIVNISSTRALQSEPFTEPYSASKGAVVALTHSLAVSLGGDGVRVNCVSPGWIDVTGAQKSSAATKPAVLSAADHAQHPVGRVGVGADVAECVWFLCDATRSGFITGQNHVVDGGMTKKMVYC